MLVGHAGLFLQTRAGSVLCDPWFTPAYFSSWYPFPSNADLDLSQIASPDYLYVSHLHRDHFDPDFLAEHVNKNARVILPEFPTSHLRDALTELGFHRFIETVSDEPLEVDGLRLMVSALTSPTDGPIGDSALAVDDGEVRVLNQNDARPTEHEAIADFGPFDAHFLQYSGAIWYPMVYDFPDRMRATVGRRKRINGMQRAHRYVDQYHATNVFPTAGPPCFLDEELYSFNDIGTDDANVFPDQSVFLDYLSSEGVIGGHLLIPGSVADFRPSGECTVTHPIPDADVAAIFSDKDTYLRAYQQRTAAALEAEKAGWPPRRVDVLTELKQWWEPLLEQADYTCEGVSGRMLFELVADPRTPGAPGNERIVIDFLERSVVPDDGRECRYQFRFDRSLVETCIARHDEDWINSLLLSCRFAAHRTGPYNEYIYNWFKTLSDERMAYVEGYYAQQSDNDEVARAGDYLVQRRCPHLQADLTRFGSVRDGVLTCSMHGWQFDLATGSCLTGDERRLRSRPDDEPAADYPEVPAELPASAQR